MISGNQNYFVFDFFYSTHAQARGDRANLRFQVIDEPAAGRYGPRL